MSTILILLIFVWSQISGNYVIALFIVSDDKNMSTMNNESCISCICKPMTRNCNEEICTDPKSVNLCKNKTHQAITEFSAPVTTNSLRNIGFIFKMFICMCIMYMFIIHASGDCFESRSTRRIHPSLNQILSDEGLQSTNSDDRSCVMPSNVYLRYDNNVNDPPPSYDETQITRTHVTNPRCTTQGPLHSSDLNYVELNTFNDNNSARLLLTSPLNEPPPSYDEFLAIHRSKTSQVYNLPPNCVNDHILYMAIPVDAIETARDSQTTFVSETEMSYTQV
ncbi:PREDICTED: uncharacterized protein LOC107170506 [Diuraphis noxia]|uniref:uncharacterized protein LOC107170506 n=1 Tax=Diuraphis noxia TaxID=143948 RepID=UPI000763B121|nr:PREDICTED: uncharacterized protein LOC107170506 [Diuraphis noxia]